MARRILAVLLLAMAAGQLSNITGFVDIVATYQVGGHLLAWPLGAGLIAGEIAGGAGLLIPARALSQQAAATVAVAVAAAWTLLGAQAFARGLPLNNCGCFGVHLGQPLRWWVLLEDAEFVILALWVRRGALSSSVTPPVEHLEPAA